MPKPKSHKGLLKRIKVTASGKVRFHPPNSRHLKSNKTGTAVQSFRKARILSTSEARTLGKVLHRSLLAG
ncbi:MAG: ribosomal protein [Planctomycetota bacterium]|jgi:large subunit ribosomal protein L35